MGTELGSNYLTSCEVLKVFAYLRVLQLLSNIGSSKSAIVSRNLIIQLWSPSLFRIRRSKDFIFYLGLHMAHDLSNYSLLHTSKTFTWSPAGIKCVIVPTVGPSIDYSSSSIVAPGNLSTSLNCELVASSYSFPWSHSAYFDRLY